MDVLSEVLRVVKLEGALFFNAEFSAPWCLMNSGLKGLSQFLTPTPGHLIIYHFLTEGRAYTQLPEGKREELTAGDIVVYPHGRFAPFGQRLCKTSRLHQNVFAWVRPRAVWRWR